MSKPKLTYFNLEGVAEKVRLVYKLAGVDFDDNRISFEEWGALKPKTPCGVLPILEVNGQTYTQSDRMAREAAKKASLIPCDDAGFGTTEEVIGAVGDIYRAIGPTIYIMMRPEMLGHDGKSEEERKAIQARMRAGLAQEGSPLNANFKYIDGMLAKNAAGFVVGDKPTLADCYLLPLVRAFEQARYDGIPANFLDAYPNVKKFAAAMYANPAIKAHYKL